LKLRGLIKWLHYRFALCFALFSRMKFAATALGVWGLRPQIQKT